MSVVYFPFSKEDDRVVVYVDDPGSGYLQVDARPGEAGGSLPERIFTIAGDRIGRMLRSLTRLATGGGEVGGHRVAELWPMTVDDARRLLPAMQCAVIYATAGTDRAAQVLDEIDPSQPPTPLCVRCDVGARWADANPHPNPWCEQYGHRLYGAAPSDTDSWDRAQRRYGEYLDRLCADLGLGGRDE